MPRIAQSEQEKIYKNLVANIDKYKAERRRAGVRYENVAMSLGFKSPKTLYHRLSTSPGNFTLEELIHIANLLNTNIPTLLGIN